MPPRFSSSRHRPLLLAVTLVLGSLVTAGSGHAEETPAQQAARLQKDGVAERRAGRPEQAARLFEQALKLAPTPRIEAQLGLAYAAMGRWLAAEKILQKALSVVDDPYLAKNRIAFEQALAKVREHIGELEIVGGAAGAKVLIGEQEVAVLPLDRALRLPAGKTTLRVVAAGYQPLDATVSIEPGKTARQVVALTVVSITQPSSEPAPAAPIADPAPAGGSVRTPLLIAGGSATAAFLAMGIAGTVIRFQRIDTYNKGCVPLPAPNFREPCDGYLGSADTATAVSIAGYALAGGFAIATATLWLWPKLRPRPRSAFAKFLGCGPAGSSIVCSGRF